MNTLDKFINEYLQISQVAKDEEEGGILKELLFFLKHTRIKDRRKVDDFEQTLKKEISEKIKIGVVGEKSSGKSKFINEFLGTSLLPKNKTINFIIKYSNIPYIRIHKNNQIVTHNTEMLEIINECDFVEIFINIDILKEITIIESNDDFKDLEKCDFYIYVSENLKSTKYYDFAILNKVDLLTKDELEKILKDAEEKYSLIDKTNFKTNKIPLVLTSIINKEDSTNLLEILNNNFILHTKDLKYKKIEKQTIHLLESTINSYEELTKSYQNLIAIIKNQDFVKYTKDLQMQILNDVKEIYNEFGDIFNEANEILYKNIQLDKVATNNENNILKVKKTNKKNLYSIDLDSIKEKLLNENSIYARKYRANLYKLSKLKSYILNSIKMRRDDFIGEIKIWQIQNENFDKQITFISEIHIDNLKHFALKIYENIINIFIIFSSQIMIDLHSKVSKIEALAEDKKKILIELLVLIINRELAKNKENIDKNDLQKMTYEIVNDYFLKNININTSNLNNLAEEIEKTKISKCEQINKIINDINDIKIDVENLLNKITKNKILKY